MASYDLGIVGGGFAGLTCAAAAASRGLRTVVIERKTRPGAACHTTGILVKEVADAWDVPAALTRRVHGVRLYGPSLRYVDLARAGYFFLATDTPNLVEWLAARARDAGAEIRCGVSFQGATERHGVIDIRGTTDTCRFLVGADGPRSRVAEIFGLGQNRRFLVGAEVELTGVRGLADDRLHVFLDSRLAPGYIAWAVPGVGVTQIGLAARGGVAGRLDELLARLAKGFDFRDARIVARRGGLIPCGGPVRPWAAGNVMLLGDAAGMVSPLTAGGIHPAMQLGRLAGVAVANRLLDGGPTPASVVAMAAPTFFWKRIMRLAFDALPTNWLLDEALSSQTFRRLAQAVFFHHRGLFSLDAWRDILLAVR